MHPPTRRVPMSMGCRQGTQPEMWVAYNEISSGPGHRFYEKLNELLREAGFDCKAEALCAPYYESSNTPGRKSVAPGVYFRMHLIGYFEGIESERGLEWRCADSMSLRRFLGIPVTKRVPDHTTLSKTRQRLPLEVHQEVFSIILGVVDGKGLLKGRVLGVDSTFLRADASMKAIVRRDTGESYKDFIKRLAEEAGVENPTDEDARRQDRTRKGKTTSNGDWESKTDGEARVAKLKDGRTRLAYKPEHVVDLETGVIVAAPVYPADEADTATIEKSLEEAAGNLKRARGELDDAAAHGQTGEVAETEEDPSCETTKVVADKGYNKATVLRALKDGGYRTYIPERKQAGYRKWTDKGGKKTAAAFYENRARVRRPRGRALQRKRGEIVERTFAHVCETGGARRTRLRGRANVQKRYLLQVAASNLGVLMRALFGLGTPRGWADRARRPNSGPLFGVSAVLHLWIVSLASCWRRLHRSDILNRHGGIGCYIPTVRLVVSNESA